MTEERRTVPRRFGEPGGFNPTITERRGLERELPACRRCETAVGERRLVATVSDGDREQYEEIWLCLPCLDWLNGRS